MQTRSHRARSLFATAMLLAATVMVSAGPAAPGTAAYDLGDVACGTWE